jgi:hypothetical protein
MALENEIDYERLAKAIREGTDSRSNIGIDPQDLQTFFKQIKQNTTTFGGLTKEILTGQKRYKDLTYNLDKLDQEIEKATDSLDDLNAEQKEAAIAARADLIEKRKAIQTMAEHNASQKALVDGTTQLSKALVSTAARTAGNFAKGLQDGASAFTLAGGLMEGAIDGMNAGSKAVGAGMSTVGSTMAMSTNPKVKALGMASSVAGGLITGLGDAAAAAGKFVVGFMVKEMEKTVDAFNKTSASGALFADGMTGMRNAAADAGLTVKQFSEVMQRNSTNLAQSGLGVTEGAKQMGRVGKIMKDNGIQDSLLKLGYGFEEQAELTATTIANMRRSAGGTVSDREVATQTAKYAENLRLIASITGEDAKKKVEAVAAQNQILAFQQKTAGMSKEQRAQLDAAMATMTEQEQKNFRDRVVFGEVINKEGAIYESTIQGAREKGEAAYALVQNNQLTAESAAKLNADYADQIRSSVLSQQDLAKAAMVTGGVLGDVAKAQLDVLNQTNVYTKDGVANAKKNVADQKTANDELTNGVLTASKAAQQLAMDLEKLVLPQLGKFAYFSGQILAAIQGQLEDYMKAQGKESWWDKIKDYGSAAVSGAATGAGVGAMAGTVTVPGIGTVSGAVLGGVIGAVSGIGAKAYERNKAGGTVDQQSAAGAQMSGELGKVATSPIPAYNAPANMRGQGDDPARYSGLNIGGKWPGEAIAGGVAMDGLIAAAKKLQEKYPGGRFNAFNDTAHTKGDHVAGKAVDFSLPPDEAAKIQGNDAYGKKIVAQIKEMGFNGQIIDEYNHPSGKATGGHIHAALAGGGIVSANPGGTNVKLGEGGRDELVTPLINGRLAGMDELIDAVNRLVSVAEDQHSTSEKILYASS